MHHPHKDSTDEAASATSTMRRSYLIQRLNQPQRRHTGPLAAFGEAMAFGGGLPNGGLTADAMGLLREIFSFDYMGAAEFEFGAVPQALDGLAKDHRELTAREFSIDLATLAPRWDDDSKHEGTANVWLIARSHHADEAESRIRAWASEGYASRLKETTRLSECLSPSREDYNRTDGWLELDNGFFFFTDRRMFEGVAALFGLATEAVA